MFAIITCISCKNDRIVDLSTNSSVCPFCGKKCDVDKMAVKFQNEDQSIVRDVFQGKTDVPRTGETDPMSKLAYLVSHCNDIGTKMAMIARELPKIKEEFTAEDIDFLVPGKGEKIATVMLENCIIYEAGYGRYRV